MLIDIAYRVAKREAAIATKAKARPARVEAPLFVFGPVTVELAAVLVAGL